MFQKGLGRVNIISFLLALILCVDAFRQTKVTFQSQIIFPHFIQSYKNNAIASETLTNGGAPKDFAESFVAQKNYVILENFFNASDSSTIAALAQKYVNYCDESFDRFLDSKVQEAKDEAEKEQLGRIRYEINIARREKLKEAHEILRDILSAGGLKQMEAKLNGYLKRSQIDMAFRVILQLNIEDAIVANVTTAVQVMTHLETLMNEYQDAQVSPPVLLVRLLVRENDELTRRQMLREKLLVGRNLADNSVGAGGASLRWGPPDVELDVFRATVDDVLAQVR